MPKVFFSFPGGGSGPSSGDSQGASIRSEASRYQPRKRQSQFSFIETPASGTKPPAFKRLSTHGFTLSALQNADSTHGGRSARHLYLPSMPGQESLLMQISGDFFHEHMNKR
jgi:hypothetical protein